MPRSSSKRHATPPAAVPGKVGAPPGDASAKRVTMRDIAEKLGVSHVTVSYALRGLPRVSMSLRERVRDEAERMGYRPDPMLQALSVYRRTNHPAGNIQAAIAWLCCWDPPEEMYTRREFQAYRLGAQEIAEKHGFRLEQFAPAPELSLERIRRIMRARGIRGVLVPPPQKTFGMKLGEHDWGEFAVVKFGHAHSDLRVSLVTSAHTFNAMLAVNRMTALGYLRVGFVTSDYFLTRTQFLPGVLRAQVDIPQGRRVPCFCLTEAEISARDTARLGKWLGRHRVDAVLTNMSEIPAMLRSLGLRVPRDIGLAVFSIHDGKADAGIDQNPLEIGKAACEAVISLILYNSFGAPAHPRELLIEGSWVDGSTLPPRPAGVAAARAGKSRRRAPAGR